MRLHLALLVTAIVIGVSSCTRERESSHESSASEDPTVAVEIRQDDSTCTDCLTLERVAVLGNDTSQGFLKSPRWGVQDSLGRYWVFQGESPIKVFDSTGRFVTQVGRMGKGPGEFLYPLPIYTDSVGSVHVLDLHNTKEVIVGRDFKTREERAFPSSGDLSFAVPIPGQRGYVVSALFGAPVETIGPLIHVVDGQDVRPIGPPQGTLPINPFTPIQRLAVDTKGRILSINPYTYQIDVWGLDGNRLATFAGPPLNDEEVSPAMQAKRPSRT
jgi:hypothetical protein